MSTVLRLFRRLGDQRGITLTELMVTIAVFAIAALIFTTTLASMQSGVNRQLLWQTNNTQARLAIENLDRQIRSGNVLYAPQGGGSGIIVYTQSNAPTFQTGTYSGNRCVQWRVQGGDLQSRSWRSAYVGDWTGAVGTQNATAWRTVAEGVVNYVASPNVAAFSLDPDPYKGGRVVNVNLLLNDNYERLPNQTVTIQVSVTGRNTSYGTLTAACSPTPA